MLTDETTNNIETIKTKSPHNSVHRSCNLDKKFLQINFIVATIIIKILYNAD